LKDGGTNVKVQKIFILKNNMKNIHILPTSQLSRLVKIYNEADKKLFELKLNIEVNDNFKEYQNIYITSDEEIKEEDWCLDIFLQAIFQANSFIGIKTKNTARKIILTTDQDLIADGVQAIDDEFLEWFIKNPSCEEVKIESWQTKGEWELDYKIIIPKEEPKQEPLEEVAEKVLANNIDGLRDALQDDDLFLFYKGVIQCYGEAMANYQAKRMYSAEDMTEAFIACWKANVPDGIECKVSFNEWFEQFKKK
jgi:hypothetical protein